MIGLVVMLVTGLIVGWRVHEDVLHAVAAVGLLVLFASTMIWTGTLLGLISRSADAVQGLMFMTVFPLTFLSQRVRAGRRPARRAAGGRQLEPDLARSSPRSATLFGNARGDPGRRAVAARSTRSWPRCCGPWRSSPIVIPLTLARYKSRTTD